MQHLLRVTPVIAILDDRDAFKPVLNPAEVEELFDAPLEMFLKVFPVAIYLKSFELYSFEFQAH